MDKSAILALYQTTVRQSPAGDVSTPVARVDDLVLITGRFLFVSWWTFGEAGAEASVRNLVETIRTPGQPLIWRVYESDGPGNLEDVLSAHGFIRQEPGRLMVLDLAHDLPSPDEGLRVERVEDEARYHDWSAANNAAFGVAWAHDDSHMQVVLADRHKSMFVAYAGETPAGAANLWTPPDKSFCGLLGGGVVPSARGKGIYRAMTLHRLNAARAMGYRYAVVDANAQSGPRLEQMGFEPLARETTWTLDFPA